MREIQARRQAAMIYRIAARRSITDPVFNLREISKQMVLLEDHLGHPYKICPDCIRKHLLTIEALAEEATSLNTDGQLSPVTEGLAELARQWMEMFTDGESPTKLAGEVRAVRKSLVPRVFDPRSPAERIASLHQHRFCTHR